MPSIIAELKRHAAERKIPKGEMIMGYGYDDTVMPDGRLLNRDDLDQAFPDNPVRVDHVSMHGAVMNSLALKVQQGLGRDPHGGEIFCFRGRKGDLIKILWHDGVGMSLYLKRLEAGKFIWPVSQNGAAVPVSAAQLGYLLEGIDWRNPRWTQRPASAG